MSWTNNTNSDWNTLHGGSRVPVNDTGIPGAPFALFMSAAWEEGCINKAVVDTWTQNGGVFTAEDIILAEDLQLDFNKLNPYIFKDMLYGYNGEAYNINPKGMLDYRGYPTPLQQNLATDITYIHSSQFYNPGGNIKEPARSVVFSLDLEVTYKLPYAVYGLISIINNNTAVTTTYETKIDAGSTKITHYREPQLDPELDPNEWIGILSNIMYLSVNTEGLSDATLSIGITYNHTTTPINSGSSLSVGYVLSLAEYSTDTTPGTVHLGEVRELTGISQPDCFLQTCNEFNRATAITSTGGKNLFISNSESFQIGTKLYADNMLTVDAGPGTYWWVEFAYTLDINDVFTITKSITLDNNSLIIDIQDNPQGWMGSGCWISSSCN